MHTRQDMSYDHGGSADCRHSRMANDGILARHVLVTVFKMLVLHHYWFDFAISLYPKVWKPRLNITHLYVKNEEQLYKKLNNYLCDCPTLASRRFTLLISQDLMG